METLRRPIANERETLANSLWSATANTLPPCPPLEGDEETITSILVV